MRGHNYLNTPKAMQDRHRNSKTYSHEPATLGKQKNIPGGKREIIPHWTKQMTDGCLSDAELTQLEQDVLAKGLNFAITPQHLQQPFPM